MVIIKNILKHACYLNLNFFNENNVSTIYITLDT
nr:MAG TPA: hypothetical protein [Caudoviricetes sp.]